MDGTYTDAELALLLERAETHLALSQLHDELDDLRVTLSYAPPLLGILRRRMEVAVTEVRAELLERLSY